MSGIEAADEVQLSDFKGIIEVMADGQRTLQKLHTSANDAWDAMTASALPIEGHESDHSGVSFVVSGASSQNFMCGLASAAAGLQKDVANNMCYGSIAFAVQVSNGNFSVHEKGTGRGQFGNVQAGDTVKIALNAVTKKVDYSVNGQVRYTSRDLPEFPLYMKCCAKNRGPLLEQLRWTSRAQAELRECTPQTPLAGMQCRHARALRAMAEQKIKIEVEKQQLEADLEAANAEIAALRAQLLPTSAAKDATKRASHAESEPASEPA